MPSYVTPKKNTSYILYTSLVSQADTKLLKSGPTLATGDFKVSIDGGAFANLATLPTNTPGGVLVKISLSAGEMNGDNISVACLDVAGAEWCDQLINIQTSARQIDDLAFPATTGRSIVVDAAGLVDANAVKLGPTGAGTAQTARDVGASVVAASVTAGVAVTTNNDKTGYTLTVTPPTAVQVRTEMDSNSTKLANLDAAISSRSTYAGGAVASVTAPVTVGTNSDKTGYTLTTTPATAADVLTQVNVALDAVGTELASVPTTVGSLRQKINLLFQYFRNKRTVTSTTETLFKEDATTTLGTSALLDDGTTFTKGELT